MPQGDYLKLSIEVRKSAFYALSYIIAKLGDLKDDGQKNEAFLEAWHVLKEDKSESDATSITNGRTIQEIIELAKTEVASYIDSKALQALIEDLATK